MTRTAIDVAHSALGDLYEAQRVLDEMQAVLTMIMNAVPGESTAHALAQLGHAVCDDWSETFYQWAECMEGEMSELADTGTAFQEQSNALKPEA